MERERETRDEKRERRSENLGFARGHRIPLDAAEDGQGDGDDESKTIPAGSEGRFAVRVRLSIQSTRERTEMERRTLRHDRTKSEAISKAKERHAWTGHSTSISRWPRHRIVLITKRDEPPVQRNEQRLDQIPNRRERQMSLRPLTKIPR